MYNISLYILQTVKINAHIYVVYNVFFYLHVHRFKVETKPEAYIPSQFTGNGRPKSRGLPSKITHLQHVTHTPERDLISSRRGFHILEGRPKKAQLYFFDDDHQVRVGTWKLEEDGYRQLRITKCQSCEKDNPSEDDKPCKHGSCCTYDADSFTSAGNPLVRFSKLTCYRDSTDPSSCNGRRCYCIESVLPGTYVWFGVAHVSHGELDYESDSSIYGMWSYVCTLPSLLQRYREQFGDPVLRCGGTFVYSQEICYVVVVTDSEDDIHDDKIYPQITSNSRYDVFNCCNFLDSNGRLKSYSSSAQTAPIFRPAHVKRFDMSEKEPWDHIVFAFNVPNGSVLKLKDSDLLTKNFTRVDHTYCGRYKYLGRESIRECNRIEMEYLSSVSKDKKLSNSKEQHDKPSASESGSHK